MSATHVTNFGLFISGFVVDLDGFIYTTIPEVRAGRWSIGQPDVNQARAIAKTNRRAIVKATRALKNWRLATTHLATEET